MSRCWHHVLEKRSFFGITEAKEPFSGESTKQAVKPLRREGRNAPAALYARVPFLLCANRTRDRGCSKHPVFPAPSRLRDKVQANLGRGAPRERGCLLRRHSGARAARTRNPSSCGKVVKWILGLRLTAHPGMTIVSGAPTSPPPPAPCRPAAYSGSSASVRCHR